MTDWMIDWLIDWLMIAIWGEQRQSIGTGTTLSRVKTIEARSSADEITKKERKEGTLMFVNPSLKRIVLFDDSKEMFLSLSCL